jgi:hypothetical protein
MVMNLLLGQQELPPDMAAGILAVILGVLLIVCVISLVVGIIVSYLLYSCFERIPPQHRQMESWQAFLLLIPCFQIVWNFFVLPKLARSYQSYFAEQGRTDVGDCGEQIGLWFAICCVAGYVPMVQYIAGPAALVLGIIYLVKVLTLKGQIPPQQSV